MKKKEDIIGMIEKQDCKLKASYLKTNLSFSSTNTRDSRLSKTEKKIIFLLARKVMDFPLKNKVTSGES
jgi:hypothetical protein